MARQTKNPFPVLEQQARRISQMRGAGSPKPQASITRAAGVLLRRQRTQDNPYNLTRLRASYGVGRAGAMRTGYGRLMTPAFGRLAKGRFYS